LDLIYIFAESSWNTSFKSSTTQVYNDIAPLGKRLIEYWGYCKSTFREFQQDRISTFEDFIMYKPAFALYIQHLNRNEKPKRMNRKELWDLLNNEEGLKKDLTIAMLR
jgi:hypothetical protein